MQVRTAAGAVVSLSLSFAARADVVGFLDSPTTNSVDFADYLAGLGLTVDNSVNFDTHPIGALIPDFYAAQGVIFETTDSVHTVDNGNGSGDCCAGTGEGYMPDPETYCQIATNDPAYFDIIFDTPRVGAGITTADMSVANTPATLTAFDSGGNILGVFSRVEGVDFEFDELYFMGIVDTDGRIARLRFDFAGDFSDSIYIPEIRFTAGLVNTCFPDCDGNGTLDLFDFLCFVNDFNANGAYSNCDGNGSHDLFDFLCYVNAFNAGC